MASGLPGVSAHSTAHTPAAVHHEGHGLTVSMSHAGCRFELALLASHAVPPASRSALLAACLAALLRLADPSPAAELTADPLADSSADPSAQPDPPEPHAQGRAGSASWHCSVLCQSRLLLALLRLLVLGGSSCQKVPCWLAEGVKGLLLVRPIACRTGRIMKSG